MCVQTILLVFWITRIKWNKLKEKNNDPGVFCDTNDFFSNILTEYIEYRRRHHSGTCLKNENPQRKGFTTFSLEKCSIGQFLVETTIESTKSVYRII